jgi:hypothetical protein
MARAIVDLERDIRALSNSDKEELLNFLISELDSPIEEFASLARELTNAVDRTGKALESAISRLENLDEELRRGRIEVREAVLRSGEQWPFGHVSSSKAN